MPDLEIQDDKFDYIWEKLGAEIGSKFLKMLPVTPYYIVVVGNPEEMIADEFDHCCIIAIGNDTTF